ncbi:MAG: S9 family peptidase, partial [Candidatus Eisenbacteria bacterium]|nr:S9 family peptidase [Candidatus Eisenbacteria bacterium]
DLSTGKVTKLAESAYGCFPVGHSQSHDATLFIDAYGAGDHVLYLKRDDEDTPRLLFGVPLEKRSQAKVVKPNSISDCHFTQGGSGIIFFTSVFSDTYGLGCMDLSDTAHPRPVEIRGLAHEGNGELTELSHVAGDRYLLTYNIDGCSWVYESRLDEDALVMTAERVLVGEGELAGGVLESCRHERDGDRYAVSFSTATSPTQIYVIDGGDPAGRGGGMVSGNRVGGARPGSRISRQTRERVLGVSDDMLSPGEDASFTSYDGLMISARLYLPAPSLGFVGRRPLVYYVHGGPQSQERPDFAWFSMPLIQFLTLSGFAVFVPNVRGSTGYGYDYMKHVLRDWGGKDRLDHVHAMTKVLPRDERMDTGRAGVVGRSYGGYMTLTLAARHPGLWSAACDMFGPYDLIGFASRVPETWKPFMAFLLGDPETDRELLVERSPKTYMGDLGCPLLVIQGKNDPRVIEVESRELVEKLRGAGRDVDYLMFEDEGHDVLKYENRVRCYNAITGFFVRHLKP